MTEHTHTAEVDGSRYVRVPEDWPVGAEVTVTWTEPDPEPSGRWVTVRTTEGVKPFFRNRGGWDWGVDQLGLLDPDDLREALAALVDLIESDHLPPQMPSVRDIRTWIALQGYEVAHGTDHTYNTIIRGTLDAIAALDAHGRTAG